MTTLAGSLNKFGACGCGIKGEVTRVTPRFSRDKTVLHSVHSMEKDTIHLMNVWWCNKHSQYEWICLDTFKGRHHGPTSG